MAWAWWAALAAVAATYAFLVWRYAYWRRRGVPAHRPRPFVGSFLDAFLLRKCVGDVYRDIYRQFPDQPVCGYFKCLQPALMIRDPDVVGSVLVKDFSSFRDNDVHFTREVDPAFSRSPFTEKGDKWKQVRTQLTPTFTPARLRGLSAPLEQVSEELADFLRNEKNRESGVDVKRLSAMAATDAVALCMLGVKGNALKDRNSEFGSMCRFLLDASLFDAITVIVILLLPGLASLFSIRFVPDSVWGFFRRVTAEATEARKRIMKETGSTVTDYLQLSMSVREKHPDFTGEDAAAHAAMFFMDGFEPTSTALAMALYHLALDTEVQERAAADVAQALLQHGGKMHYDSVQDMKYLDMVVAESLRLYPPLRSLDRLCSQSHDLQLPGGRAVHVEAGTPVIIPVHAIHLDPAYYPDPHTFDPEHFEEGAKEARPRFTYLPFGEGPRICLGQRYALTVIKMALATVLRDWRVAPLPDTPRTVSIDVNSAFYLALKETLRLRFLPRAAS